jgi:hypothetical protein
MSGEEIQWRPFVLFAQLDAELVTKGPTTPRVCRADLTLGNF